jgi:glycine/D-amino acid oxidase-like deaminating enzyme
MNPSIWAEDLADVHCPVPSVPADADTVIIGAGYTGLNAARELARSGQRVVVFDKDSIGDGASGVNFGSVALGVAASWKSLADRHGDAFARSVAAFSRRVLEEFCRLLEREAIDCDLRKSGHITVAMNRGQLARLENTKKGWGEYAEHGFVMLSEGEAKECLDLDGVCGGLLNPDSYSINPAKYLAGLLRAAGAMCIERTPVSEIRRIGPGSFESRCGTTVIRSKHVVVCTDGIPMPGFKPSRRGIVPIHSYIIATAPLTDEQLRPVSGHAFATAHMMPDYFRRTADNRLLFGSRRNLAKPSPASDRAEMIARMNALLPFTTGFPVTHSWSGSLGLTVDRLPHVGVADGIHYALGYNGKGIPWSAHCGMAVADLVRGVREPDRVVATPLIQPRLDRGRPWFLRPLAWYYRTKDALSGFAS